MELHFPTVCCLLPYVLVVLESQHVYKTDYQVHPRSVVALNFSISVVATTIFQLLKLGTLNKHDNFDHFLIPCTCQSLSPANSWKKGLPPLTCLFILTATNPVETFFLSFDSL